MAWQASVRPGWSPATFSSPEVSWRRALVPSTLALGGGPLDAPCKAPSLGQCRQRLGEVRQKTLGIRPTASPYRRGGLTFLCDRPTIVQPQISPASSPRLEGRRGRTCCSHGACLKPDEIGKESQPKNRVTTSEAEAVILWAHEELMIYPSQFLKEQAFELGYEG